MKNIILKSDNCNSWNKKDFTDSANYDHECPSCSGYGGFYYIINYFIWRWEISIPYNWQHGQWEALKLYPAQVSVPTIKCAMCGEKYRVYPSFVIKGTTLTQSALLLITYIYELSGFTWRGLSDMLCEPTDKIAHSTLFKAVHGLGNSLMENQKVRESITALMNGFLPCDSDEAWPEEKSRFAHTLGHERSLRQILKPLLELGYKAFTGFFFKYLRLIRRNLSWLSPPISRPYR